MKFIRSQPWRPRTPGINDHSGSRRRGHVTTNGDESSLIQPGKADAWIAEDLVIVDEDRYGLLSTAGNGDHEIARGVRDGTRLTVDATTGVAPDLDASARPLLQLAASGDDEAIRSSWSA